MFLRVDPKHAGANALGILVPQGSQTLVIARPRPLEWDLLPARWDGESGHPPQFCIFSRDEAANVARRLVKALEAAVQSRINPLESFGDLQGGRVQISLRAGEFVWILCKRFQGRAYQPILVPSPDEATCIAEQIAPYVWPAADRTQEYYFNTQNFSDAAQTKNSAQN
jgi:hypothetical protein